MPQDQNTGAAGNTFGRESAPLIAQAIGAKMLGTRSNEATYQGKRIVIKCAAQNTNSVGVTYRMLKRLDFVFGAFQQPDGCFEVFSLPAALYKIKMRETRSQGAAAGKVGLVARSVFESKGSRVQRVHI